MIKALPVLLAILAVVTASANETATAPSLSTDEVDQIESAVNALADAQTRVFGSAVAFCAANYPSEAQPLDVRFKAFIEAFKTGTKAGMVAIAATDKDILRPPAPYQAKDLEMLDQQAAEMLASVQRSAGATCNRLAAFMASGSGEAFRERALASHQEYKARRAAYCARSPKPKNCD